MSKFKAAVKNGTVRATEAILGDAHFMFQSLADGTARLEASIVHRLTGELKKDLRSNRVKKTQEKQDDIKKMMMIFHTKVRGEEYQDALDLTNNM